MASYLDHLVTFSGCPPGKDPAQGATSKAGVAAELAGGSAAEVGVPRGRLPLLRGKPSLLVIYHYFEQASTCAEDEEIVVMRTNLLYFIRCGMVQGRSSSSYPRLLVQISGFWGSEAVFGGKYPFLTSMQCGRCSSDGLLLVFSTIAVVYLFEQYALNRLNLI